MINSYTYLQLQLFFLFKTLFGCLWFTNSKKIPSGYQEDYLQIKTVVMGMKMLFAPVHSLYVMQIVVLQLSPLQLERICDKACLGGPWLSTQMHFHWNLKSLEFNCYEKDGTDSVQWNQNSFFSTKILAHKIEKEQIQVGRGTEVKCA